MIPRAHVVAWSAHVPWRTPEQVEQDLVLRRLVVEVFSEPALREELAFWGGTCLHTLHLPSPLRYSEDLDFRRRSAGAIGPVLNALRAVAARVGMTVVKSETGRHPKLRLRGPYETGGEMRVKIEMNTRERSPVLGFKTRVAAVSSPWFAGSASVVTFATEEILATKIRAMFEREKGRDLFDLWLGLELLDLDGREIARVFDAGYRPARFSTAGLRTLLDARLAAGALDADVRPLLGTEAPKYEPGAALERVAREVLAHVRER